jgi:serine/threonine-protein kinase
MEHKIFLGKYRVAADEMALAAPETANTATAVMVTEQHAIATIYRGVDIENGRDVSIEVIPAGGFKRVVREELENEANAAKKINHINVPALYDFGFEDDQLIYVTEHFDGTSAEEWVNQHGPMPTGAVLRIALQVVGAMGASAFHRISHHAINPSNVMLVPGQTPEGDWPLVKVLHFVGVAPTFSSADISVASFDKTTHYASPEQLRDGKVDFRSEIYSLGATMWFLLTGAPPLIAPKGPLAMQPSTIGLSVDKLNGMPKRVRRLLGQMLSADPAARPQDPLAFYGQIRECLAQVDRRESMARRFGVPFRSESKPMPLIDGRRRFSNATLAIAAALLALLIAAGVIVPRYLHHQRVRAAEEPIGVPIGVPDPAPATAPSAAAPPVVAATNTVETTPAPTIKPLPADADTTTAQAKTAPAPAITEPSAAPVEPKPALVAASGPQPQQQTAPPPPAVTQPEPTTAAIAQNNPPAPEPVKPVLTETPAIEQPKIAANETTSRRELEPVTTSRHSEETRREEPATTKNTEVAAAIPTARPVAPEVRRAEPAAETAAPAEGPDEAAAPPPPTEKRVVTASKPKKERVKKPVRQPQEQEETIARAEPVEDVGANADTAPMPQLPKGKTRARFIGVTADGNWMFSLPSKKIVIVPPPPGG